MILVRVAQSVVCGNHNPKVPVRVSNLNGIISERGYSYLTPKCTVSMAIVILNKMVTRRVRL